MKATNKHINIALVILLLVVIAANNLSIDYVWVSERIYVPENSQESEWMQHQLEAKGIQYRIDEDNNIAITSEDNGPYKSLISKIREERMWFKQTFGSSDQEYLKILKRELEKAGIEYRIDYKNEIKYREHEEPRFKSIVSKVDDMISGGIPKTFSDDSERKRFIALLNKEGIPYRVLDESYGSWISWFPGSNVRKQKIREAFQSGESSYEYRNKT